MRTILRFAFVLALVLAGPARGSAQQFYGEILLKPVDGVLMEVQQPFGFLDARNRKWEVPAKFRTDGASIPRALWSIIGSPFTGNYLAASIIHDFYCDLKSREWREVHQAFFDTMIASKVENVQAKVMYYAVYRFGPRWVVNKSFTCPPGIACAQMPGKKVTHVREVNVSPVFEEAEFRSVRREIESGNLSLSKIRAGADASFYRDDRLFDISGQIVEGDEQITVKDRMRLKDVPAMQGSLEHYLSQL
jgi:hypothetical protein